MRQLKIGLSITLRNENISKYLQEIDKTPLLTVEEEIEICHRIKNGDTKAIDELVKANLRFVVSVAKQYAHNSDELADFIQAGNEGCIVAAQKFDVSKGFKFITYAVWWIRQRIMEHLSEQRAIRIPQNHLNLVSRAKRENEKSKQIFHTENMNYELEYKHVFIPQANVSFDNTLGDDDTMLDVYKDPSQLPTDSDIEVESNQFILNSLVHALEERQGYILTNFYGLGGCTEKSMEDIGKDLKLTRERVRQIHNIAISRLKKNKVKIKELIKF